MQTTRRTLLRSIGAGTAVLGTAGVATARPPFDDDDGDTARVRVLHASPDAPAVDVFVDGTAVLTGVPFKTISGYLDLPPGSYDVAVAPAGAGVGSAVIEATLTLSPDTDYTVAAVNELADIAPAVFVDDNEGGSNARARVRAVHLSPDAPAVDLAQTDGPGVGDGSAVVAEGLAYQNATGYLSLAPTSYEFAIRAAGTTASVFDIGVTLDPGATYTAFAVGLLDPDEPSEAFDVVLTQDVAAVPVRAGGKATGR